MKNIKRIAIATLAAAAVSVGVISPANAQVGSSVDQIQNQIQAQIPNVNDFIPNVPALPAGSSGGNIIPGPINNAPVAGNVDVHMENATVGLINQHRVSRGMHPMATDPVLTNNARRWSGEMAAGGPWTANPYRNGAAGAGRAVTPHATPETLVHLWKDINVIDRPTTTRIGVGIVNENGTTFANVLVD